MFFLYSPMASVCPVIITILLVISVVSSTRGASITRSEFQAAVHDPKTERNSAKIFGASELKQRNLINHNSIKGALEGDDDSIRLKRSQLPSPSLDKQHQALVMAGRSRLLVSTLIPAAARLPAPSLRTRRLSSIDHAERLPTSAIGLMEDPPSFVKPHQGARTRRIVFQRSSPKATSQLPRGTSSVALGTVEHRHRRNIDQNDIYSSLDSSSLNRRRQQDGDSERDDDNEDDDSANDDGDTDESDDDDNENRDDTDDSGIDFAMLRKKRGSETTNDTVETYMKQKENVNTIDTLSDSLPAAVRRRRQIDSDDDSDDVCDDSDVDHGDGEVDTGENTDDVSFDASVLWKKREPKRKQMRLSEQDAADEEVMSQERLASDRPSRQVDTDNVKKADIEKEPMETDGGDLSGSNFNDSYDVYDSSHAGGGLHIIDASSETNSKRWSDVTGGIGVVSVHYGTPSLLTHSFTSTDRQRRQSNIVQDIISADDEMDESEDIEDTDIDEEEDENDNVDLTMFRKRRDAHRNENKELFQHHADTNNEATNTAFISKSSRQYVRVDKTMPAIPDLAAHKQEFGLGYIGSPDYDTLNISSTKTQLISRKNTASPRKLLRSQRSSTATLNTDKRVLQVLNSGDQTGNDGEDEIESDLDLLLNDLVGTDEIDLDDSHMFQIV